MADELAKARDRLKAQWLQANRTALEYQKMATEASKRAAALQTAMDALEAAMAKLPAHPANGGPVVRGHSQQRIAALLKEKGRLSAKQIAEDIGLSYGAVISALKKGPYSSEKDPKDGRGQLWTLSDAFTS